MPLQGSGTTGEAQAQRALGDVRRKNGGAGVAGIDEKMTEPLQNYYHYWGKAEKEGVRYHLLPYHCLDVAAIL